MQYVTSVTNLPFWLCKARGLLSFQFHQKCSTSDFSLCEGAQNAKFVKIKLLPVFCKAMPCDFLFLSGCQDTSLTTWHLSITTYAT